MPYDPVRGLDLRLRDTVDPGFHSHYLRAMRAVEFTVELKGKHVVAIPEEVVAQLPKAGRARVIILTDDDAEDAQWRHAAYEQFCRDDASADTVYVPASRSCGCGQPREPAGRQQSPLR